jgi:hypothetical protein
MYYSRDEFVIATVKENSLLYDMVNENFRDSRTVKSNARACVWNMIADSISAEMGTSTSRSCSWYCSSCSNTIFTLEEVEDLRSAPIVLYNFYWLTVAVTAAVSSTVWQLAG